MTLHDLQRWKCGNWNTLNYTYCTSNFLIGAYSNWPAKCIYREKNHVRAIINLFDGIKYFMRTRSELLFLSLLNAVPTSDKLGIFGATFLRSQNIHCFRGTRKPVAREREISRKTPRPYPSGVSWSIVSVDLAWSDVGPMHLLLISSNPARILWVRINS